MTTEAPDTHSSIPADTPLALRSSAGLGAWLPIATAPRDGSMVLVNDTTPGWTPWVAASYLDGDEWQGWVYDDATAQDSNPLGPSPTHWFAVPELPKSA